jgi:DNA-binding PadR family transcriptional regulator
MHPEFAVFWPHGRHCGGRHGRRHGFGGLLGAVIGRGDIGWHDLRSRRRLGADDLQLLILALLAEKPAHGYEIIKSLEERSGGFYSPSPGMVYPALTYLEEIGHASVEAEGTRKLYRITDTGRAHLEEHRATVDTILAQLKWVGEKMAHVRRAFAGEHDEVDDAHGAREGRRGGLSAEVHEARMRLRAALVDKRGASDDEQRRIAEILARAANEIRGK